LRGRSRIYCTWEIRQVLSVCWKPTSKDWRTHIMFTILGAKGFIGSRLAHSLTNAGLETYCPARDDAAVFLRELGNVVYAIGVTADFRKRPFDTIRAHVSFLNEVLEKANFTSLTYLSSTRVYSKSATASPQSILFVNPADSSDLYNLSKLAGEAIALNCGRPQVRVVRLSNVVGNDMGADKSFIGMLIDEALHGAIHLRTSPESSKDYIHIDDVVEILPKIATLGTEKIYNVASGTNTLHRDWIAHLSRITGCSVTMDESAELASFPQIDVSALQNEFSFAPRPVLSVLDILQG